MSPGGLRAIVGSQSGFGASNGLSSGPDHLEDWLRGAWIKNLVWSLMYAHVQRGLQQVPLETIVCHKCDLFCEWLQLIVRAQLAMERGDTHFLVLLQNFLNDLVLDYAGDRFLDGVLVNASLAVA